MAELDVAEKRNGKKFKAQTFVSEWKKFAMAALTYINVLCWCNEERNDYFFSVFFKLTYLREKKLFLCLKLDYPIDREANKTFRLCFFSALSFHLFKRKNWRKKLSYDINNKYKKYIWNAFLKKKQKKLSNLIVGKNI